MFCQYCHSRVRGSAYPCRRCRPKLISAIQETCMADQIAVEITMNGSTFRGYLPLAAECTESN